MKIIELKSLLKNEDVEFINKAIKNNEVFIYPTDTLYGIGGNFFSIDVINKIDDIKRRADKPYSVAVSDYEMLKGIVKNIPEIFFDKYMKLLPGKYTFLFEIADHIDKNLVKGSSKIGVRIPDSPEILQLIKKIGIPIITTSVNETGDIPFNSPKSILEFIKNKDIEEDIAFIIDGGDLPYSGGSTIIDLTTEEPAYLR